MTSHNPLIISIDGNVGAGKTRLLTSLAREVATDASIVILHEPVDVWTRIVDDQGANLLELYYKEPVKYAFALQATALITRHSRIEAAAKAGARVIVMERTLATDIEVFAKMSFEKGNMSPIEWKIYQLWSSVLYDQYPISGIVYVTTPPSVCKIHIANRGRPGEELLEDEWLGELHRFHEEYIEKYSQTHEICRIACDTSIEEQVIAVLNIIKK